MKNYYLTLGLAKEASADEIKSAYRKLALECHPDRNPDNSEAEEKFKSIAEAYTVLSDPEKKSLYDATGSTDPHRAFNFRTRGDPLDIFSQFGMRTNFGPQPPRPRRGHTLQQGLQVSLVEALFGSNYPFEYTVASGCDVCEGEGGTEFEECVQCNGQGGFTRQTANMISHAPCGACTGRGKQIKKVCDKCVGRGIFQESKSVSVVIPPGIYNGAVLKLQSQGGRGVHGGPSGDVLLQISVVYPNMDDFNEEEKTQLRQLLSKDENPSP